MRPPSRPFYIDYDPPASLLKIVQMKIKVVQISKNIVQKWTKKVQMNLFKWTKNSLNKFKNKSNETVLMNKKNSQKKQNYFEKYSNSRLCLHKHLKYLAQQKSIK